MNKFPKIFNVIIIGFYILTLSLIARNLNAPYLWYDEAGQFFISKGLNHDSNPFELEKGVYSVIKNNAYYNMDPGGFSLILHFWSKISNSHIWLRTLPFLFFIGTLLAFIYLSYKWINNISIALLMGFIPIFIPLLLWSGFELRAYSMECFGTLICIIGLYKLKDAPANIYLFLWSCLFTLFMTSRYSEIIVVFIASVYILFIIYTRKITFNEKLFSSLLFSIPPLIGLTYIYFTSLIYQNKELKGLGYLSYIKSDIRILLAPENLLFLCILGLLLVSYFLKNKYSKIKKYEILLLVTICVNVLFILLSVLGKHPWMPYSKGCISILILVLLCFSAFMGEIIKPLLKSTLIVKYCIIVSLLFALYLRKHTFSLRLNNKDASSNFTQIDPLDYTRIYVDRAESPCIRYLLEFGAYKTTMKNIYPEKFTFGKWHRHGFYDGRPSKKEFYLSQPKMNDYLEYDLIISHELHKFGNNDKWIKLENTTNFFVQKDKILNK